ncbi:MAG: hypothetical protein U1F44_03115 [Coriobacteriia bacterium]|nr:hypothetical protein [Coriobacteriia bacterium]
MVHRTKLYQQARSPLIQGRSRIERSLWRSALLGGLLSFTLWVAALAGDIAGGLEILVRDASFEVMDLVPGPALGLLGAALLGGYLGAGIAVKMGWHKSWKTGLVVALLFDLVAYSIIL